MHGGQFWCMQLFRVPVCVCADFFCCHPSARDPTDHDPILRHKSNGKAAHFFAKSNRVTRRLIWIVCIFFCSVFRLIGSYHSSELFGCGGSCVCVWFFFTCAFCWTTGPRNPDQRQPPIRNASRQFSCSIHVCNVWCMNTMCMVYTYLMCHSIWGISSVDHNEICVAPIPGTTGKKMRIHTHTSTMRTNARKTWAILRDVAGALYVHMLIGQTMKRANLSQYPARNCESVSALVFVSCVINYWTKRNMHWSEGCLIIFI